MSPAQLRLYDEPTRELPFGDLRDQLARMSDVDRVWFDAMLAAGFDCDVVGDATAERERVQRAINCGLRVHLVQRARGRRRVWLRPCRDGERGWLRLAGPSGWWTFIVYEPRYEPPIGGKRRAKTVGESHWGRS